jgi:hypothetical protein
LRREADSDGDVCRLHSNDYRLFGLVAQQQVAQPEHQDRRPGGRAVN